MNETIKALVIGRATPRPVYECRNCGMSVTKEVDTCPACSSESIVHYEIG